jgi:uncharacterized protein DUF6940
MWSTRNEQLARGSVIRVEREGNPVMFAHVLRGWRDDPGFRTFFTDLLAQAPYEAFRWETPSITADLADRPFEFALLDSPELVVEPDPRAFAEHFRDGVGQNDVLSFPNLNHDAILVVPRRLTHESAYAHLAAFVRDAPESQRHLLWKAIGELMMRQLGPRPIWLSTAGAGVPWLHVRLDQRPKYYCHAPYRQHTRHP